MAFALLQARCRFVSSEFTLIEMAFALLEMAFHTHRNGLRPFSKQDVDLFNQNIACKMPPNFWLLKEFRKL